MFDPMHALLADRIKRMHADAEQARLTRRRPRTPSPASAAPPRRQRRGASAITGLLARQENTS